MGYKSLSVWRIHSQCTVRFQHKRSHLTASGVAAAYALHSDCLHLLNAPCRATDIGGLRVDFMSFNLRSRAMPLNIPPLT